MKITTFWKEGAEARVSEGCFESEFELFSEANVILTNNNDKELT